MAELAYGVATSILEKLGSVALEEISLAYGLRKDLEKLQDKTLLLRSVLNDAEKKKAHNERLKMWLGRVKDVFNDTVDVLDEFECEMLRRQVVKEYGNSRGKVHRFFSRDNPVVFRFSIAHKVKGIRERLEDIGRDMAQFQLISSQLNVDEQMTQLSDRMTHSYVKASEIIGRDIDKAAITDMLLSQDDIGCVEDISVVPIVGIGGLGKTTLAKLVYNDSEVRDQFDLKLWVCVSLDFDVTCLLREILSGIKTGEDVGKMSIEELQISLRSNIEGKKLLLVLDDVWNENRSKWIKLRELLTVAAKGSRMIVTTRSTLVSDIMTRTPAYHLKGLSKDLSLSLFFTCAFGDEKLAEQLPRLKDIGKVIARKCGGVPLALKTLGCLLYSKAESEWARVRDHKIWELKQEDDHILPALRLSYDTMSPCLRQCFAYCSMFPEDARMNGAELVSIWMALGILHTSCRDMELEDIARVQLKELRARSFFQYTDYLHADLTKHFDIEFFNKYSMHDLIHDLACSVTETECCIVESGREILSNGVKHLRIYLDENNFASLRSLKKLWSLHVENCYDYHILKSFVSTGITPLRHLRVLDLKRLNTKALPSSLGTLKHLRYLNLSGNHAMKRLPDSICELQSLQTLLLRGCKDLEELPTDIRKLVSLRYLSVTTKQTYFSENGIGCLKSLRTLVISMCKNLKALPQDMKYHTMLRSLFLINCDELNLACKSEEIVAELSLQKILIRALRRTTELPQWLKGASGTLRMLILSGCKNLVISPEWLTAFTSLEKLHIYDCPQMLSLPEGKAHLTSLTHLRIEDPSYEFYERYQPEVGRDWASISHIPNIYIKSPYTLDHSTTSDGSPTYKSMELR